MKGFTLIELIIYIAIVSVVLILASGFAWNIIYGDTKAACYREVQQNARLAMERITRDLKAGSDPAYFSVSDGVLYKITTPLTTDQIEVTNFQITPIADTFKVDLSLEYRNPENRNEYQASLDLVSTVALRPETVVPPLDCWGTGGSCDLDCSYSGYGSLTNYYIDPGCSDSCSPIASFYDSPSGSCSSDGTGNCYKMTIPSNFFTGCLEGDPCEGSCGGDCMPCFILPLVFCLDQDGCNWDYGENECEGTCTPCSEFSDLSSCEAQYICLWDDTKWFWNLVNPLSGFTSYVDCQWYE